MNKYYKNNIKTNNLKISYTQICKHKKTERINLRIEEPLKILIKSVSKERGISFSDATRLLWVDYLSKRALIKDYKTKKLVYGVDWEL